MTRTEISAGGVIFKKSGKKFQILLIKDKNNNWTFPKGLIEDKEKEITTAKREIAEEVGLKKIKYAGKLTPIGYYYKWQKDLIKKTVYYFLFENRGEEKLVPQKEEGIQDVKWFTPEKALKIIGYRKTNEPVLKEVIEKLYGMGLRP